MNIATRAAPITESADRFRCESEVPDPPRDAAGRKQYWEDTVAEAVAELRRRLASTRDEKSFQALQMIVDLEKTRLRHKAPVADTEVSAYSSPLPPMEQCVPGGRAPKKSEPAASATVLPDAPSPTLPTRTEPAAPPPRRYRYVQYPLDAPINAMTDDEYNAYRRWQGFWPGVPPGWPNWPPKPAAVVAAPNPA